MKYTQLTNREIFERAGSEVSVDVETYPNYTLICVEYLEDGGKVWFEGTEFNKKKLMWIMQNNVIHTFNGINFDMPIILYILTRDVTERQVYEQAQKLIGEGLYWMQFYRNHRIAWGDYKIDHVDLIEVAFGHSSLKLYGGRLHALKLQDLPYPHYKVLTEEEKRNVLDYCWNDTATTIILKNFLEKDLQLRRDMQRKYRIDLRSKSDAQIAEAVISSELKHKYGIIAQRAEIEPDYSFNYQVPDAIKFETPVLQNALEVIKNATFRLSDADKLVMPREINALKIQIGNSPTVYKMGIGGLHSTEKWMYYEHDDDMMIIDRDVASYYPAIILNQGLFPKQLTRKFLDIYRNIVNTRLKAKADGDKRTANSLKIVINGSFGKFGSAYSILFAPELLIQTTVSGQLYLLMLIERLELAGFGVISGNTDGIVTRFGKERYDDFNAIIHQWEKDTGFDTEETQYHAYFARDVNNYCAIKPDGSAKSKGCFGESGISKNPSERIVYRAVADFLSVGRPVEDTISSCTDIREFVTVRTVNGGCVTSDGDFVGKVVRFYKRKGEFGHLKYDSSGNKVPKSDGAYPIMDLTQGDPHDIDYVYYIREAKKILSSWFDKKEQLVLDL